MSFKLVDFLLVQVDKSWYNYYHLSPFETVRNYGIVFNHINVGLSVLVLFSFKFQSFSFKTKPFTVFGRVKGICIIIMGIIDL